ncbi:MAG: helix-hairpin-helix domain-containing protein [Bacteroidales bacterium]|nr:helix-hairpin-helix domain-containing protein [Bacteroidales bacterium]
MENNEKRGKLSASFIMGAVALAFLAIGYQTALFVHRATQLHILAAKEAPDTVYVVERWADATASEDNAAGPRNNAVRYIERRNAPHSRPVQRVREQAEPRRYESFRFNPNTATIEDLKRLGFTQKQAESIDHYRQKGGRFRRKEDFAKSFVVADSVFHRLEAFIDIPKIDLNRADSAAFDTLPGIGGYFAAKMVSYREQLGGYSYPEQLMDLWHFDQEKYDGLKDLITLTPPEPYPLWTLPEEELKKHPYIRDAAHGVVLFREHHPREQLTVEGLEKAGVLPAEDAGRLARCRLVQP